MAPSHCRRLALAALVAVTVAVAAAVPGLAAANDAAAAAAAAPDACVSPPPRVVRLNPDGLFDAAPFGFTQLSVDTEAGVVYLSGQAALLVDATLAPGDLRAQAKVVRENILTGLAAVGSAPADILRITTFIVDFNEETDAAAIIEIGEALGRPSHTVVGVQALAFAGMRVEVEVTAVVPAAKLAELRSCRV